MKRKPKMYVYLETYNFDHRIPKTSKTLLAFIGRSDMKVFLVIVFGGLGILMIMQLHVVGDT